MSVSSLHHPFKAVTAMTPMHYQKQLRLREARRLMLVELLDVESAGYAVGYRGASTNLPRKSTQLAESGGPPQEHSLRS